MVQIPLKKKYRSANRSTYKGGERAAAKKHRVKIGHAEHVKRFGKPAVYHLVVDGLRGTGIMVKQS